MSPKRIHREISKVGIASAPQTLKGRTLVTVSPGTVVAREPQTFENYVRSCEVAFKKLMPSDWALPETETWRDAYDDELTVLEAARYVAENEKAMAGIDGDEE